jgi:hypothetical protein
MRFRRGMTCATATCAGATAAFAGISSCVSNNNAPPPGGVDASFPPEDGATQQDTSAPAIDSGTADSSPPADTGADTSPVLDSATFDANPGCVPGSIAAFTVPAYVHANPQSFACSSDDQIDQDMAALCLDAGAFAACSTYASMAEDGGPQCGACLITSEDAGDGGYGPAIIGVAAIPNVGGCVEIADQTDAGLTCAMAVQAAWRCTEFSCTTNCPVSDTASRAAYLACLQAAALGPCVTYTQAANACLTSELDAGGNASQWCVGADGGVDQFTDIARFFCSS